MRKPKPIRTIRRHIGPGTLVPLPSRYTPHQGAREIERRRKRLAGEA